MTLRSRYLLPVLSALAALACAIIPAAASALTPTIDTSTGKTVSFSGTIAANATLQEAGSATKIICTGGSNKGTISPGSTGTAEFTFTGCKESTFGTACTSPKQLTGTITTGESQTHLLYVTKGGLETPGILITPPVSGTFAEFTCAGFISKKITGNGIIGEITSPECGKTSTSVTVSFTASGAAQTYASGHTFTGPYSLLSNGNLASETAHGTSTLEGGATATLTCP